MYICSFRKVNTDGFKPNLETHLIPLLATKHEEASTKSEDGVNSSSSKISHHPLLMQVPLLVLKLGKDLVLVIYVSYPALFPCGTHVWGPHCSFAGSLLGWAVL